MRGSSTSEATRSVTTPRMATKTTNAMTGKTGNVIFLFLLAAGQLAGCTSDDSSPQERPLEIRLAITDDEQEGGATTRATTVGNTADLQAHDLCISAYLSGTTTPYLDNKKLHYNGSVWTFWSGTAEEHYYWPVTGSTYNGNSTALDFVGYTPAMLPSYISLNTYSATDGPSFTCTALPVNSIGQSSLQEFLYAYETGKTLTDQANDGGTLSLPFHHPFAMVNFQVCTSHRPLTIEKITVKDVCTTGAYTHSSGWSCYGSSEDMVVNTANTALAVNAALTSSQQQSFGLPFLVLPQSISTTNQIEIRLQWPTGTDIRTLTLDNPVAAWKPGKSYTYTLDFGETVKFGVTIADWNSGSTDYVTFNDNINFKIMVDDWAEDNGNSKTLPFD